MVSYSPLRRVGLLFITGSFQTRGLVFDMDGKIRTATDGKNQNRHGRPWFHAEMS
ncbi:hypothetical protein HMPREF9554_01192 [Treponema phagedenis F0421]|nr:hypothetical protein HMPREF9554_01192 [Treponema phagedenis F0421]